MFNQVKLSLPQNEFSALVKLALGELRDPPSQVRQIVRQELERRGLLTQEPSEPNRTQNNDPEMDSK